MRIALDYDDTYTEDRGLWNQFIRMANENGHSIYMVTLRSYPLDNNNELTELSKKISIIFCNGLAKQEVVSNRGIHIDIWIDDDPRSIIHGSRMSEDELLEWRKQRA